MKTEGKELPGSKKGQAVMEYLITYGLALFVILVVLGILVAVVIPALKAPEECQFTQPGFSCNEKQHVLVADKTTNQVKVLFYLTNDQGSAVNITKVSCTSQPAANVDKTKVPEIASFQLPSGAGHNFNITCLNEDNSPVIITPNSNFKGSIAIVYQLLDEVNGAPTRLAVATLTGTVQKSD